MFWIKLRLNERLVQVSTVPLCNSNDLLIIACRRFWSDVTLIVGRWCKQNIILNIFWLKVEIFIGQRHMHMHMAKFLLALEISLSCERQYCSKLHLVRFRSIFSMTETSPLRMIYGDSKEDALKISITRFSQSAENHGIFPSFFRT